MGRTGWLDRVRHRPTAADLVVSGPAAEVVAAFRADPGLTDLRPVTKAMTRDISGWILGHPAVRSAEDAWALRSALLGSPDLQALVEFRDDAQRRLLTEALAEGDAVPPLYLYARLDAIADRSMDDFLALLPAGSAMLFDVMAGTHRPELCERVIQRTRAFGIRAALTGLKADGSEDEVVRRLAPDVLMLDVNPPMDYRDRLPDVLRLRAEVGPHRAEIVMGGVSSAVDEWAGNVCGADHLTGPLYDNEDLSALTSTRDADPGDDKSAYEQAASWYPPRIDSLATVLGHAAQIAAMVRDCGDRADAYVAYPKILRLPPEAAELIVGMADAGAAVTVLAPAFDGLPLLGLTCTTLDAAEPLAQGWVLVALFAGQGHIVAAINLDKDAPALERRHSYVVAEDRDLALRIANRISQRAAVRA